MVLKGNVLAGLMHAGDVRGDEGMKLADAFGEQYRQERLRRFVQFGWMRYSQMGMLEAQSLIHHQQGGIEKGQRRKLWGFAKVSGVRQVE